MVKILIAGDFCPTDRVQKLITEKQFHLILQEVREVTKSSDFSIVNLECPIVEKGIPIKKEGPHLSCGKETTNALIYGGFDCVTLANNHFYDYGELGVRSTLETLNERTIEYLGAGHNRRDASKILFKEIKNQRFAFINICEHEFSIATETTGGSNPLDLVENYYQIQEARNNADIVIVIIHGGHEHYQFPSPRMKSTFRFLIDIGADAIINHHQHCYSGYEIYKTKPIFFGIGNFCFDLKEKRNTLWNEGYMVQLEISQEKVVSFNLIPYTQCNDQPQINLLKDKSHFEQSILKINSIIEDDKKLEQNFTNWVNNLRKRELLFLEPYSNKYLRGLRLRKLIPSVIGTKWYMNLYNRVNCESHKEVLLPILKQKWDV